MKATLQDLKGKYYGTIIEIIDDSGNKYEIKLWNNGSGEPSDRELMGVCTIEQWRNNENVYTGDPNPTNFEHPDNWMPAREIIDIVDSHFESRETHALAVHLINLINNEFICVKCGLGQHDNKEEPQF